MANNKLILRSLTSPYTLPIPDITKSSVLSWNDVDNNFIYLKGMSILSGYTDNGYLILDRINGEQLSMPFSGSGGSGTPGGLNTHVQFNDAGSFGGDDKFTFDKNVGSIYNRAVVNTGATGNWFTSIIQSGVDVLGFPINGIGLSYTGFSDNDIITNILGKHHITQDAQHVLTVVNNSASTETIILTKPNELAIVNVSGASYAGIYITANDNNDNIGVNINSRNIDTVDILTVINETTDTAILKVVNDGNVIINEAYSLPTVDGLADQVIANNGDGTTRWDYVSGTTTPYYNIDVLVSTNEATRMPGALTSYYNTFNSQIVSSGSSITGNSFEDTSYIILDRDLESDFVVFLNVIIDRFNCFDDIYLAIDDVAGCLSENLGFNLYPNVVVADINLSAVTFKLIFKTSLVAGQYPIDIRSSGCTLDQIKTVVFTVYSAETTSVTINSILSVNSLDVDFLNAYAYSPATNCALFSSSDDTTYSFVEYLDMGTSPFTGNLQLTLASDLQCGYYYKIYVYDIDNNTVESNAVQYTCSGSGSGGAQTFSVSSTNPNNSILSFDSLIFGSPTVGVLTNPFLAGLTIDSLPNLTIGTLAGDWVITVINPLVFTLTLGSGQTLLSGVIPILYIDLTITRLVNTGLPASGDLWEVTGTITI